MTQSEKSLLIEKACAEIISNAPKPKPKQGNWNVHILVRKNRKEINRLIKLASEKYGIEPEYLKRIILK